MRIVAALAALVLFSPGCSPEPAAAPAAPAAAPAAPRTTAGCKPTAPVQVTALATDLGAGVYALDVEARALADVERLELRAVVPAGVTAVGAVRQDFAATGRGAARAARFRVRVDGPGAVVPVSARVTLAPGIAPNEVVEVTVGTPPAPPAPRLRTLALPNGIAVDEVMP